MNQRWQTCWEFIRRLATDDAYDRYVQHHREHHPSTPAMDRRAFYLKQQQEKWTGVKRCC
jgi:uncharacterized short protein YbdD (DUF466 family)